MRKARYLWREKKKLVYLVCYAYVIKVETSKLHSIQLHRHMDIGTNELSAEFGPGHTKFLFSGQKKI